MAIFKIIWYTNNFMTSKLHAEMNLKLMANCLFTEALKAREGHVQSFIITLVWENSLKGSFLYRLELDRQVRWNVLPCWDSILIYSDTALINIDNIAASYTSSFKHP